jgi:hypothetical protein
MLQPLRWCWVVLLVVLLAANTNSVFAQNIGGAGGPCPGKPNAYIDSVTDTEQPDGRIKRTITCRCNDNYGPTADGRCLTFDPVCIRRAGETLDQERKQTCAQVTGRCFKANQIELSGAALSCVFACNNPATCALSCGILGLTAQSVTQRCIEERNTCFEDALRRHNQARESCRMQPG